MRWAFSSLALLAAVPSVHAAWTGEVEFGLVVTHGNSNTGSFNVRLLALDDREHWRHQIRFNAVKASTEDQTTAERYVLEANSHYKLNQDAYLFGNLRYNKDRFSGFEFQLSVTSGYGRRWEPGTTLMLELEGGAGVRQSRVENMEREQEGIVRGAFLLRWAFSPNAEFRQRLTLESGEDNTLTESISSLRTKIIGRLAMKFSLTVTRNSDVPVGKRNTDTLTSVNLVYDF